MNTYKRCIDSIATAAGDHCLALPEGRNDDLPLSDEWHRVSAAMAYLCELIEYNPLAIEAHASVMRGRQVVPALAATFRVRDIRQEG